MSEVNLKDRDFTLVIDSSGSMATADQQGRTRWKAAEETSIALAGKAQKYDTDGLTLYTFSSKHKKFENVVDNKVAQIFDEVEPNGSTNLAGVLEEVFVSYRTRKAAGTTKANGEVVVVITDGAPDDQPACKRAIVTHANSLERDEEFGVLFVQVGNDGSARAFLKSLDDDLKEAKFDIVDAITMDEAGDRSLTEVLAGAIAD